MANGGHPRRLLDNDDVVVDVANNDLFGPALLRRRVGQQLDGVALLEPAGGVLTEVAEHADAAGGDEGANLVPRLTGQPRPQHGGESGAGLLGRDGEGGKRIHETVLAPRCGERANNHSIRIASRP